jgi:CobQ-like glutamine amidotransferase family enzyme
MLLVVWGVVTAVLIVMLIYRSTLSTREEDQIFLGGGEDTLAAEQRVLVARIEKLSRPIMALMVASGALLAITAGVWLWQVFRNF